MKYTTLFTWPSVGFIVFIVSFYSLKPLYADYTIVLNNNGRITVEDYWEERGMVNFRGLGGVIGLAKQSIDSIVPAVEAEVRGIKVAGLKNPANVPAAKIELLETPAIHIAEEDLGSAKAKEEQELQNLYKENQNQIKSRTDIYWDTTRGTRNPDPTLLNTLRALNGRIADLQSRIKDAQRDPSNSRGTGIVNLEVNSPFAGRRSTIGLRHGGTVVPGRVSARPFDIARPGEVDFPTKVRNPKRGFDTQYSDYTYTERELSNLRAQLNLLYGERQRLIQEMQEKEVFTGSVPFEAYP